MRSLFASKSLKNSSSDGSSLFAGCGAVDSRAARTWRTIWLTEPLRRLLATLKNVADMFAGSEPVSLLLARMKLLNARGVGAAGIDPKRPQSEVELGEFGHALPPVGRDGPVERRVGEVEVQQLGRAPQRQRAGEAVVVENQIDQ